MKTGDLDECGLEMDGGGTQKASPRTQVHTANTGSLRVRMRQLLMGQKLHTILMLIASHRWSGRFQKWGQASQTLEFHLEVRKLDLMNEGLFEFRF